MTSTRPMAIRELGDFGRDLTVDDITGIWHIGPTPTVLGHFLARPVTPADLEVFHEAFEDAARVIEPFDGIATLLRGLRDDGYRLGVYTTATRRAAAIPPAGRTRTARPRTQGS